MNYPTDLRPVLALIQQTSSLGLSERYEVVYYDDEQNKWCGYVGGTEFQKGKTVIDWVYCENVIPRGGFGDKLDNVWITQLSNEDKTAFLDNLVICFEYYLPSSKIQDLISHYKNKTEQ